MLNRFRHKIFLFFLVGVLWPRLAGAATAPLVPLKDWTYSALEKLGYCGLLNPHPLSLKPLSRIQVAKMIAQAIDHVQQQDINFSSLEDTKGLELLLDGLMEEYQKELIELGVTVAETAEADKPKRRLRIQFPESLYLEKTIAGLESGRSLLIENNQGWRLYHGLNLIGRGTIYLQWNDWISVVLTPTLRMTKMDTNLLIEQFYAESEWKNLRISVGRQSFWWGPAHHGALILSNNAFPFDSIRFSSAESYRLPGPFEKLGDWRTDFFLAQLGREQNIKHPKFSGIRQEWSPADWLSFGGSHTIIFGGEGARGFSSGDLVRSFFESESGNTGETENHLAGWDWQFTLPKISRTIRLSRGLKLYGEYSFEDASLDVNILTLKAAVSHLHGLYLADLFKIRDFDLRVEIAEIDSNAYEHFFYRTGYKHKGEFMGHPAGPDSRNLYLKVTKKLNELLEQEEDVEIGLEWDFRQDGMVKKPMTQTLNEISLFFQRPGPWSFLFKTALTVLQWKNFDHRSSPLDTDLLLTLEASRQW